MKSKLIKAVIAGIIVLGVAFGGFYGYKTLAGKPASATVSQYYSVAARKMNLQVTIQGTGAAYAAVTKDVAPNNNGTLKSLTVKVGDTVTTGQKLYTADSDDLRKAVTSAQNNLTKQKLTLTTDESAEKVDDNKVAMDKISVSDAQSQLNDAYAQLNKMTVTAPIGGVVTAVNNINGDSVSQGKSVLTIVDMSSMKVKVAVDELDIGKVKASQAATIKFDAIKDKSFDGTVETIAQTGTSSNNVTTYDVVVAIKNPTGIKLGMNANVTISVESKDNALVIPADALVENNGQKFVRLINSSSSAAVNNSNANSSSQNSQSSNLTSIKTGLETENYIEVTDGLKEGDKVQIKLTQASSSNSSNKGNAAGGFGGDMGGFGGPQGGNGGPMPQGSNGGSGTQGSNSSGTKN
ncbi:efflux RND transporter periplasmic adaptor subunit [Candidatus Clostridium radicumherbarum]|uniref:Efflux RND transporter periplasmic adaptor subunit n=1 Tax=Candidatus Clostridium radicumherbarum TaxID=3381662 RepID=A0ABW8TMV5_9CLOT